MGRAALLALVLFLPWTAAGQIRVELVVDTSAAMGETTPDGRTRLAGVQDAVAAVLAALPGDDPDLSVGLRTSGGELTWSDPLACQETRLVVPVQGVDREALLSALRALRPSGSDPIVFGLMRAVDDLQAGPGRRVVVVVSDGDSGLCSAAHAAAAQSLQDASVELCLVGGGLEGEDAKPLVALAKVEKAASAPELLEGLRKVLGDLVRLVERRQLVAVRVGRAGADVTLATAELVDLMSGQAEPLRLDDGAWRGQVRAGVYDLDLTEPSGRSWTVTWLVVAAGSPTELAVELPEQAVTLWVSPEPLSAGAEATVRWRDAPEGHAWLTLVPTGAPVGERGSWVAVAGQEGEAQVVLPESAGELEARYHLELPSGASLLVGRCGLASQPLSSPLQVPAEVEVGTNLGVVWDGPVGHGDCLLLVPAGSAGDRLAGCVVAVGLDQLSVTAPDEVGVFELRYLSGRSTQVLARATVTVVPLRPRLTFPAEVMVGTTFEVSWSGPDGSEDYLAVSRVGAADGEYLSFAPTSAGTPARLDAPRSPGQYEVRYAGGRGGKTLASSPLAVVEAAPEVRAPSGPVMASTRFAVEWQGPDRPGDYLAVAEVGAPDDKYLDWSYTSGGSPLTLAAPERPGKYELRYVSGGRTLARAMLQVRPPG